MKRVLASFVVDLIFAAAKRELDRQQGHRWMRSLPLACELAEFDSIALAAAGTVAESLNGTPQTNRAANFRE